MSLTASIVLILAIVLLPFVAVGFTLWRLPAPPEGTGSDGG